MENQIACEMGLGLIIFLQKCFPGNSKTKPENSLKTEVTACRVMERPKFMNDVNIPLISFHECI